LRVAPVADPASWTSDDERRTEAARTFMLWRGYLPAGEDAATAASLLAACDSLARDRALADAYEGHRHRAEIARKLDEARRREAAARYSSE
ncbi:phosphohydrolase, partial [Pseudomonas sp. BGM005]|nr:phosphohydrolase [Pseudomonas sp. BG5]